MLINPFTPSEIASAPEDFFGRIAELNTLERSLYQGSVAIQGAIGIGKSSLLARTRLLMEGFDSNHHSKSIIAVGNKDINTIDEAARLILESFIQIDESSKRIKFKLGSIFELESSEICRFFSEGRHLAALKRIVEKDYLSRLLSNSEFLILCIDEADKCPTPIARLIRSMATHTQQQGIKSVRFVLAGVSPYFNYMVEEDSGINRFFYKTITLQPMLYDETITLLHKKFSQVCHHAENHGIIISIDPLILKRIAALSGGHPHLVQLLGSHMVEHENADPDNIIDARDLLRSLRKICYEDRGYVYDTTLHLIELHGKNDEFFNLLNNMSKGFPSRIKRNVVRKICKSDTIEWFMEHNILSAPTEHEYGLLDEFLRVRVLLAQAESEKQEDEIETKMIRYDDGSIEFYDPRYEDEFDFEI